MRVPLFRIKKALLIDWRIFLGLCLVFFNFIGLSFVNQDKKDVELYNEINDTPENIIKYTTIINNKEENIEENNNNIDNSDIKEENILF